MISSFHLRVPASHLFSIGLFLGVFFLHPATLWSAAMVVREWVNVS